MHSQQPPILDFNFSVPSNPEPTFQYNPASSTASYFPQQPQQHLHHQPSQSSHRYSSASSGYTNSDLSSPQGGGIGTGSDGYYTSPPGFTLSPPSDAPPFVPSTTNGSTGAVNGVRAHRAMVAPATGTTAANGHRTSTNVGYAYTSPHPTGNPGPTPSQAATSSPPYIPQSGTNYYYPPPNNSTIYAHQIPPSTVGGGHNSNVLMGNTRGPVDDEDGSRYNLTQGRKRQKSDDQEEEEDEDEGGHYTQNTKLQNAKTRLPGACSRCKGLKVKCDFPPGQESCRKCSLSGSECVIPGRKKRKPPAKRDELMQRIRDKNSLILQLLEQLEARSTIITAPLTLTNPDGTKTDSTSLNGAIKKESLDPVAQAALIASQEKREKEIAEWIKKAKATIEETNALSFGLLGGTSNLVVDKSANDDYEDDDYEDGEEDEDEDDEDTSGVNGHSHGQGDDTDVEEEGGVRNRALSCLTQQSSVRRSASVNGSVKSRRTQRNEKATALPTAAPLGFIEHMGRGLHGRKPANGEAEEEDNLGVSNPQFFRPSARPYFNDDSSQLPQILAKGIVNPKEVSELFATYFDYMNLSTCLLDERLYSPEKTLYRSPFLFTVICAIASRYHHARNDLHPILMNHARLAAGTALISGRKSLETCQAYILMAIYPIPARRWSEDRSWMFLGCALRMATDLNLHHPPVLNTGRTATTIDSIMEAEGQAREILNRTRAWISCFNIDKATSTQFGKPTTLREDWMFPLLQKNMSEGGAEWWCPTPFSAKFDIHLCAYSALLREISDFHEKIYSDPTNPTGLNQNIAFEELTYEFDDHIAKLGQEWFHRVDTHMDKSDPQCVFRKGLLQLEFYYNQLVALSFGFQHAFRRGAIQKENAFLTRCYSAASRVVRMIVDELAQQPYMRYCPESHYIFATFASAFLLKLLRPKFSVWLEVTQHHEILSLVERLIAALSDCAVDDRHAPKLYSRFLDGLLQKGRKILTRGTSNASSPASNDTRSSTSPMAAVVESFSPSSETFHETSQPTSTVAGSYNMDGIQNALPQNVWPYGISNPGDSDTLAPMQYFGEQFWDDGLLPGYSWGNAVPVSNENVLRDAASYEAELQNPVSGFPQYPYQPQQQWTSQSLHLDARS